MKNKELDKTKSIYIHEIRSTDNSNEISLIDLASVLLRRKKMMSVITSITITLGVMVALLLPKSYTYSATIEVGSQIIHGTINPLEEHETFLAKIQYAYIPQILREQRLANQEKEKEKEKEKVYKIISSMPKDSGIILLKMEGTDKEAEIMIALLQNVTNLAVNDHKQIYDAVKRNLLSLSMQSKIELDSLDAKNTNLEGKRLLLKGNIEVYESQLANLRNTREISSPMKSIDETGVSKTLIIIVTIFSGIFLAIFSALLHDFITQVKEKAQFT